MNSFYDTVIQLRYCVPNAKSFISLLQPQSQESTHEHLKFLCCLLWVCMYITGFGKLYPLHAWRSNFCLVFGFLPFL